MSGKRDDNDDDDEFSDQLDEFDQSMEDPSPKGKKVPGYPRLYIFYLFSEIEYMYMRRR